MSIMLTIGFVTLSIGLALCMFRCIKGPTQFDRVLAFDCLILEVIGIILLLSISEISAVYLDIVLIVGLLGFIGTISFASFLDGSHVD